MRSAIIGLAFKDLALIEESIDGIVRTAPPSSVYVIENTSADTNSHIKPAMLRRLADASLNGYFCFDENVTNNAYEISFNSGFVDFSAFDYITLTDFDLLPYDDWLTANINLLEKYPNIFSASAPLSLDNMPESLRAGLPARNFEPTEVHEDYDVFHSGLHLTTLRSADFVAYLKWQTRRGLNFRDRILEFYGRDSKRLSVRSRAIPVRHLTWDLVGTERSYQVFKNARGKNLWMHDDTSAYTFYEPHAATRCVPGPIRHSPACQKWYRLAVMNDTSMDCTVHIMRNWLDGGIDGQRCANIAAGAAAEVPVLHAGWGWGSVDLDVRWHSHDKRTVRAVVRVTHAEVEQCAEFSLSRYMPDAAVAQSTIV